MADKKFPLSIVIRGVDKVTAPLRRVNQRFGKFFQPFQKMNRSLAALGRAAHLDRVAEGFRRVGAGVGNVVGRVMALTKKLALMSVAGSLAIVGFIRSFTNAGDNVAKVALKLGIGIEALQEYRFAADRAGIPTRTFDMALQRFGRRAGEAAAGTGEARVAFNALGISVVDAEGKVRSIESLLPEVADKLSKIENANIRNALAMKFFDAEGVMMVQMLSQGADEMARLRQEARDLGLVISEDAARGSEELTDRLTNLRGGLAGVRNVIATALLPSVTKLVERLTDLVVGMQPKIRAWAEDFAEKLPDRLRSLKEWLGEVKDAMKPLIRVGKRLAEKFGTAKLAAIALGAALAGPLLGAIGNAVLGLGFLIGALLRTATVMTLTVIPATFKLAWALLRSLLPAIWGVVSGIGLGLLVSLKALAVALVTTVIPAVWGFTTALLANPITWVVAGVVALVAAGIWLAKNWESVTARFKKIWAAIAGFAKSAIGAIRSAIGSVIDWIVDKVTGVGSWIASKVKAITSVLPKWLQKAMGVGGDVKVTVEAADVTPAGRGGSLDIQRQEQNVKVSFENAPEGIRIESEGDEFADLDVGLAMVAP